MDLGRYLEVDDRPAVRFERVYPHPIERVWSAISAPEELGRWFPSSVDLEPRVGGKVAFSGDPNVDGSVGKVLRFDPPHHLAFTWGDDELHLDLEDLEATQCRLVLTNILSERDSAARNASGWTVCLGELDAVIAGKPNDGPHSDANVTAFQPLYEQYVAAGLPSGAPIPN
jgi:uncharacterized protein YndB with AHSA1/START domain